MIVGYTFDGQHQPAAPFAKQVEESLGHYEGILDGIEVNVGTNTITIDEGRMLIKGRQFEVVGSETVNVENAASGNLYGVLIVEIDLSKESSSSVFDQVAFKYLSSSTDYPSLVQQDINSGDTNDLIYQFELARFRIGTNGISDYQDRRTFLNYNSLYNQLLSKVQDAIDDIEDGSAFMLRPTILFEGNGNANPGVTLSDSISNYEDIEIFYKRDGELESGSPCKSIKISSDQNYALLDMNYTPNHPTIFFQFSGVIVKIQGNKITYVRGAMYGMTTGGIVQSGQEYNYIITKVLGYNYGSEE